MPCTLELSLYLRSFPLQSCPSKLNPENFLAFRISALDKVTNDTYHVRFALPGNSQLGLRPGQHLILRYIRPGGLEPCHPALPLTS